MARKNLLADLTQNELPAGNSFPAPKTEPFEARALFSAGRGAIGAVSRSIDQLKSQAVIELAAHLIDASFIEDRLGTSPEDHASLVASIREHGQQVPILVRPNPQQEGRYQIAYGHRRLRAAIELERPVRAIVKPLTDEQLVVAQGQENSARTDLSFIERALFAAQLEARGFNRETIMAALSIDKTGLSRLISSAVKIPRDIIEAIGPAPKTGRDRWVELSGYLDRASAVAKVRAAIASDDFGDKNSDDRFLVAFSAATPRPAKAPAPILCSAADGTKLARIRDDGQRVSLVLDKRVTAEFAAYLVAALPEIYTAFKRRGDA